MKLSIVTPAFNSAATIRDTLESIEKQDFPNLEHIIVDGGSTDDTLKIAAEFPRVSKIISEPDRGLYDAMNKGVSMATGEVVVVLNSDDFYAHSQVLSRVAAKFRETNADTLYADLEYVHPENTSRVVRHWKAGAFHPKNFQRGWMPPHPTFFVRRHLYERFGLFDISLRFSADYELMLRFLLKNNVSTCYLPEVIVRMRAGGASNANWRNRFRANLEDRRAWKMNGLRPKFYTLYLKPLLKIPQYL
ncbi:MAG: glycosyltransferase [Saprospiraceae bacterium]|nr:glycosyltransferase [Saprospiraceae bacterium]